MAMIGAVMAAACSAPREVATVGDHAQAPTCTGDGPWITIEAAPPTASCAGGVYTFDGIELGEYPVTCGAARAGRHVVSFRSAGDCAGLLDCELTFEPGRELVVHVRSCATAHARSSEQPR